MKTKQTAFLGLAATTTLGVVAFGTQTQAAADSLEQPVVTAPNQDTTGSTLAEPQNLEQAQSNLNQVTPQYEQASQDASQTKSDLDAAVEVQTGVQTELANNSQAITDTQSQLSQTTQDLNQAQTDLSQAEKDADKANQTYQNEATKNPTAEADLNQAEQNASNAQSALDSAKNHETQVRDEVSNADKSAGELRSQITAEQAKADELAQNVNTLASAAKDAENTQLNTEAKLAEVQNRVDSKMTELQNNVDNASTDDIITYEKSTVHTSDAFAKLKQDREKLIERGGARANLARSKETTLTDGQRTETVDLTIEQQAQYERDGFVRYTPNAEQIAKYMVDYINELREINGIPERLTYGNAEMQAIAKERADEMRANDKLEHRSTNKPYDWESLAQNGFATDSDWYYKDQIILSDKELAYNEIALWFTEYGNLVSGSGQWQYGHRNALLFSNGELAYGINVNTVEEGFVNTYSAFNVFTKDGEASRSTLYPSAVSYVQEGDTLVEYLNGKRIKFLPEITFNYISNKKIVTPSTAKQDAQKALDAYKVIADNELASAQSELTNAKAQTNDIKSELAKAKSASDAQNAKVEQLKVTFANSSTISADLKAKLADAEADTKAAELAKTTADAKLAEVKAQNKALTDAKTNLDNAVAKVKSLETKVQELTEKQDELTAKQGVLAAENARLEKALDEAKAKVEVAKTKHDAAQTRLSFLTNAYMKAQADVLKFTPKPVVDTNVTEKDDVKGQQTRVNSGTNHVAVNYGGQTNHAVYGTDENNVVMQSVNDSATVGSRVEKHAKELPHTGDKTSIWPSVGIGFLALFGMSYVGKRRKVCK